jgi:proliferating cell nuclear antigen
LFLHLDADRISDYELKLMDIDSDTLGIPDTEYDVCVTMSSSEFARIVRDLSVLGESVKIDVSKDGVRFTAEGEAANGNVLLKQTASARRKAKLVGKKEKKSKVKKEEGDDDEEGDEAESEEESSSKKKKKTKVKREEGGSDVEMVGDDDDDDEAKPDEDEDEDEGSESTSKKRKKAPSKVRVSLADGFISDLILVTSLLNPPSALKGPRTKMKMKSKEGCRSR